MIPATLATAVSEHGWLGLLITPDAGLATEPYEVLGLLDGLIIPDWSAPADDYAEFSRRLAAAAGARGLDRTLFLIDEAAASELPPT